jgi:hypothetical protein
MRRFAWLAISLVVLSTGAVSALAQCGVERWTIKVGTDSQAPSIDLSTYISTTIYNMLSSTRPASIPSTSRVAPRETNQYSVNGTLTQYKRETDSDYHLVIKDGSGRTMIVEIPSPNCVGSGSPFASRISNARAQFDAKLTATSTFKSVTAPVTIRGIGFWDFLHGQTGVAPNGIEVHPVLNIAFTGSITASDPGTVVAAATPGAVALPADMVEDNDGGRVRVYRGGDAIGDAWYHGGSVIDQPRMRVVFAASHLDDATRRAILQEVRSIGFQPRFGDLSRYGVESNGIALDDAIEFSPRHGERPGNGVTSVMSAEGFGADATDLDVQRLLASAVESGRIQHREADVVTIVVVDDDAPLAVGTTRDWLSYHSLFHPTEVGMPYVVVRANRDLGTLREALFASVARALIDPAGDGWF